MSLCLLRVPLVFVVAALAATVACGGKDPTEPEPVDSTGPLLPWSEGNAWTYNVTAGVTTTRKVTTVGPLEPVGGTGPHAATMANAVVTEKDDGADETRSWQGPVADGEKIVRYREQAMNAATGTVDLEEHWDPPKLRVDSSTASTEAGASWLEIYTETKIPASGPGASVEGRDLWSVVSAAESVTVPAGTFTAVVLRKAGGGTGSKQYWFVRGVGKVKETGTQTEELLEYHLE